MYFEEIMDFYDLEGIMDFYDNRKTRNGIQDHIED